MQCLHSFNLYLPLGFFMLVIHSVLLHNVALFFHPERKALVAHLTTGKGSQSLPHFFIHMTYIYYIYYQERNHKPNEDQTKTKVHQVNFLFKSKKCVEKGTSSESYF